MVEPEVIQKVVTEKRTDLASPPPILSTSPTRTAVATTFPVVLVRVPPEYLPAPGWAQRLAKKKAK